METDSKNTDWQIVSEVKLIYKSKVKTSERPQIKSSRDAYRLILSCWDESQIELREQFKVLLLNNAYKALGIFEVSSGGITSTQADIRLIFSVALKANATALMIVHNHPSGNLTASEADKSITRKIVQAGKLLDITLLDSLIITPESYYSFADNSLL